MGFTLDISTTRLREGDGFAIGIDANTFTISIVGATAQKGFLEANATDDILPTSEEWKAAVDRLESACADINPVESVTSNGTVISITFVDGVNFTSFTPATANGSLIVAVKTINTTGVITNFNDPLVPNITVTSISHRLSDFVGYTSESFPHGNMGDRLETNIFFTIADTFDFVDFYYGWTDNSNNVYPSGGSGDYKIDNSFFEDITTGVIQKVTGDTSAFSTIPPFQGTKILLAQLISLGGKDYQFKLVHYIPIFPRPIDVSFDNTLNKPAEILTSLKFVFQIDLRKGTLNQDPTETTALQDLSAYMGNGNIGQMNSFYNTGTSNYFLNGFVWNNEFNELNSGLTSSGAITLGKTTGNFSLNHDIILKIQELTDSFDQAKTLTQNYNLDTVTIKMDGSIGNSTILKNVQASFVTNTGLVTFDVEAGAIQGDYIIWVVVNDGTANKNNENVLAKISTAVSGADETKLIFGTYPGAPRAEYNYNFHYLDSIADSFNQVKSYVDDYVVSRFRVENTDTINDSLVSFTIRLRADNQVFESFTITADTLNNAGGVYEIPRTQYNLLAGDIRKKIVVTDNGDGTYDFIYPFQVTEALANNTTVVQETLATFIQNTAVGDLEYTNTWISPVMQFGTYDISKNNVGDPQVTAPPSKIQYFDESGTLEVGVILKTGKTLVVATFEEDNLNDFVADPTAPFTYPNNTPTENYLTAYFGLSTEDNAQVDYYRFHNLRDNEQSPFEQVPALGVNYYAELKRLDIDTATLTALIDSDKIRDTYGDDFECLRVTARLDKIQTAAVTPKAYKNNSYTNGYS